jgi:HEXXH motif-containing protein
LISPHWLSEDAFTALAGGYGGPTVVMHLREVQHSKHLLLLHALVNDCGRVGLDPREAAAFEAGYKLVAAVQAADPDAVGWLFSLPHIGGWAHDCIARLDQGLPPDLGYFCAMAAAVAVRAGVPFEVDVPVTDGRALLPGLGWLHGIGQDPWITLRSDGERLAAGTGAEIPCGLLVPDDGSLPAPVPHWQGTVEVRCAAGEHRWTVLLETADAYLNRYGLPMATALPARRIANWRRAIQSAWHVLVRDHGWAAGPVAAGVSVIVPLVARGEHALDSATTFAAFGAIATSWPDDPVILAETIVHEFQHIKLCGLLDVVPLMEPCDEQVYAPWREDPRPAAGLLQGVYAHLGVARFWKAQRHAEAGHDAILRAQVMFARWRSTIRPTVTTLLRAGCLTPAGIQFAELLLDEAGRLESEAVPVAARDIARQVSLDHWLTWQLRHTAVDPARVAELAIAYRRGAPLTDHALPDGRVAADSRKVNVMTRGRLLDMHYLEPARYRELNVADLPELSKADALLMRGQPREAAAAYRDEICAAPEALPHAWTGLALAVQLQPRSPLQQVFATSLPVMFDVHEHLSSQGIANDPLKLAAWFAGPQ